MPLPEQIQKQVDAASKIIEAHEKGQQAAPGENTPPAEPQPAPTPSSAEPSPDISKQSPPSSANPDDDDENSLSFKQRWKSLDGQLRAAYAREGELKNRLGQLEQLIATMSAAPPAKTPAAAVEVISAADREAYGEDLVGLIERAARSIADAETTELRKHVQQLTQQVGQLSGVVPKLAQTQTLNAREQFFQKLGQLVPDWEQVNTDQRFLSWLLEADPMTGIARQTYLADAQESHDVRRAANIFHNWKATLTGTTVGQQQAKPNAAKSELDKQVAPGRTLSAPAASNNQPRVWTPQEIQRFYRDVQQGVYKGRDAERAELERDIFAAGREGRVQNAAA